MEKIQYNKNRANQWIIEIKEQAMPMCALCNYTEALLRSSIVRNAISADHIKAIVMIDRLIGYFV